MEMLKKEDITLTEILIKLFKDHHTGIGCAVKTAHLLQELAVLSVSTNAKTIRNLIGHIRRHDILAPGYILSDVKAGYWLSYDTGEQSSYIDKQLNRMTNQFQNIKSLHNRVRYRKKQVKEIQAALF